MKAKKSATYTMEASIRLMADQVLRDTGDLQIVVVSQFE